MVVGVSRMAEIAKTINSSLNVSTGQSGKPVIGSNWSNESIQSGSRISKKGQISQ